MDDDDSDMGRAVRAGYITGFPLLKRQMRGLMWKRYLNWRRDAWQGLADTARHVIDTHFERSFIESSGTL